MFDINGRYNNGNYNYNGFMNNNMQQHPVPPQPQIQCFFVNSKDEAKNVQVQLNTIYLIINTPQKEIYMKKYNNDGLIDFITYKDETTIPKSEPKEEKDYTGFFNSVNEKLENIERIIKPNKPIQRDFKEVKNDEY